MKKTLLIAVAATLSLSISSLVSAGNIEKAKRYSAPLEQQNVVDINVSTAEMVQEIASSELGFVALGNNAQEVQELGHFYWDD